MLSCNPFMGGSAADFLCEFEDWFGGEHGSGRIKTGGYVAISLQHDRMGFVISPLILGY